MRKKLSIRKMFLAVVTAVMLVVGSVFPGKNSVSAVETPNYRIQLNKVIDEPTLIPGQIYSSKMNIQNTGAQSFKYKIEVEPYQLADGAYDERSDQKDDYTQLVNWVILGQEGGELKPGESTDVSYTIRTPYDVPAGGQYAIIAAKIVMDDNKQINGIVPTSRVAMPILGTIAGETRATGNISNNRIDGFLLNPPLTAHATIENTGNIHSKMTATIEVYSSFDGKLIYTNAEHPDTHTILPKSRRQNTVKWEDAPGFGLFNVRQTVEFLGEKSVSEQLVFICPLWLIILTAIVVVGLIIWLIVRARERKKAQNKGNKKSKEV